jgi:hypothetical protein
MAAPGTVVATVGGLFFARKSIILITIKIIATSEVTVS